MQIKIILIGTIFKELENAKINNYFNYYLQMRRNIKILFLFISLQRMLP
jgi:hypothetical protein